MWPRGIESGRPTCGDQDCNIFLVAGNVVTITWVRSCDRLCDVPISVIPRLLTMDSLVGVELFNCLVAVFLGFVQLAYFFPQVLETSFNHSSDSDDRVVILPFEVVAARTRLRSIPGIGEHWNTHTLD